jgi:hypothetical protein
VRYRWFKGDGKTKHIHVNGGIDGGGETFVREGEDAVSIDWMKMWAPRDKCDGLAFPTLHFDYDERRAWFEEVRCV